MNSDNSNTNYIWVVTTGYNQTMVIDTCHVNDSVKDVIQEIKALLHTIKKKSGKRLQGKK